MSLKSKKVHASNKKSKSRTVKKCGGMFSWFSSSPKDEPKMDSIVPNGETQSSSPVTSKSKQTTSSLNPFSWTSTSSNPFNVMSKIPTGVTALFTSGLGYSQSEEPDKYTTPDGLPPPQPTSSFGDFSGGKKRSRKSRTSKKRSKTNNKNKNKKIKIKMP
jgi:hypothetical protein